MQYIVPSIIRYNREKAVLYAAKWALKRNPKYYNFDKLGGDCTNFVSQVIFAGAGVMNYTPLYGWYYLNLQKRTPSWTGVNYIYDFLTNNKGSGPFAEQVDAKDIIPGDIVQLSFDGAPNYNHSLVVVNKDSKSDLEKILIATHSDDRYDYPLTNYGWLDIRFLHIIGIRQNHINN